MSNPVGESLPEPDPEPSPYQCALFDKHDQLRISPPYPQFKNESQEFEVLMVDDFEKIEIEASIYGDLVERYKWLDSDRQFMLAGEIENSMSEVAKLLVREDPSLIIARDSVALINNVPVIFEPSNHGLLVGRWDDDQTKDKLTIQSDFIENRTQQRMLLGGLAALVTYLEQQ